MNPPSSSSSNTTGTRFVVQPTWPAHSDDMYVIHFLTPQKHAFHTVNASWEMLVAGAAPSGTSKLGYPELWRGTALSDYHSYSTVFLREYEPQ